MKKNCVRASSSKYFVAIGIENLIKYTALYVRLNISLLRCLQYWFYVFSTMELYVGKRWIQMTKFYEKCRWHGQWVSKMIFEFVNPKIENILHGNIPYSIFYVYCGGITGVKIKLKVISNMNTYIVVCDLRLKRRKIENWKNSFEVYVRKRINQFHWNSQPKTMALSELTSRWRKIIDGDQVLSTRVQYGFTGNSQR